MATSTKSRGEGSADCPLCEDYSGPPSSVEAHISRKTDPIHQGEVGRAHRDDLQRQVVDTGDVDSTDDRAEPSVDPVDQWKVEPDEEPAEEPDEEDEEGNDESRPSDGEAPSEDTDTPEADPEDDSAGIPVPIDPNIIIALAILAVVAIVVYRLRSSDDEDDQDDDVTEQVAETGAGLIGA